MNVLLATGSAVLRHSVSRALLDRGHDVRGLTLAAICPRTHWLARVEPRPVAEIMT